MNVTEYLQNPAPISLEEALLTLSEQERTIAFLQEQIDQLKQKLFGRKSEKSKDPIGQDPMFNEVENEADNPESPAEDEEDVTDVSPHKRKRGKRKPLPENLPRVRQEIDLDEADKFCKEHGVPLEKIGEKVTEKLEIIPAKSHVIEQAVFQYKCPCCEGNLVAASKDPDPIPKSFATPSLLAYIVTHKYVDAIPLYRQQQIFARYGIELSRTTMARWVIKMGDLVAPLLNLMREDLLGSAVIHCDETVVQVLKEAERRADQKSYMWCMARAEPGKPIVIYSYYDNRGKNAAADLLDEYKGYVVCDGLKTYDSVSRVLGFILAGCMAHCRRKFWEAEKLAKRDAKANKKIYASEAIKIIKSLYKLEKAVKGKPPEEIKAIRQEKAKPILEAFHKWLLEVADLVLPKSLTGKAVSYALAQWDKLVRYCEDGRIPIDNNYIEAKIRPFVVGRKNWLFFDTPSGAHASSALYSLVETAKANGIDPFDYLKLIFKELPKVTDIAGYEKLLPYHASAHYQLNTYTPRK